MLWPPLLGVSSALASSRADAFFNVGDFSRALEQLVIVAAARPDDGRVQVRLGLCSPVRGPLGGPVEGMQ